MHIRTYFSIHPGWGTPSVSKVRAYYLPLSDEAIFNNILPSLEINDILSHQLHKNGNIIFIIFVVVLKITDFCLQSF